MLVYSRASQIWIWHWIWCKIFWIQLIFNFILYFVKVQSNYLYPNVQIPVTYPATAPEVAIPELDGKTAKMYRFAPYVYNLDFFLSQFNIFYNVSFYNVPKLFKNIFCHRGGKICLTDHFKPLWARNVPKFGLAHLMALGVSYVACLQSNVFHFLKLLLWSYYISY